MTPIAENTGYTCTAHSRQVALWHKQIKNLRFIRYNRAAGSCAAIASMWGAFGTIVTGMIDVVLDKDLTNVLAYETAGTGTALTLTLASVGLHKRLMHRRQHLDSRIADMASSQRIE